MVEDSNVLRVRPHGPNVVTGEIAIVTSTGVREMQTAVLCRCGRSADRPFCDGAHVKTGFVDPARLPSVAFSVDAGSG
jgi:CDGSH-type Zn-finger protein